MTYPTFPNDGGFKKSLQESTAPFIAILRGLPLEQAESIAITLIETGFRYIEVPLNTPHALEAIHIIQDVANTASEEIAVGAGTVLKASQVDLVHETGGTLIISPNMNPSVIQRTKALGMISIPGVYTVTEAFDAIESGADALKFFPAESVSPEIAKAMLTVLPKEVAYLAVGGIKPDTQQLLAYYDAGINGFGIGGGLYKPEYTLAQIHQNAQNFMKAHQGVSL